MFLLTETFWVSIYVSMNRNDKSYLKQLAQLIKHLKSEDEVCAFLTEVMTPSELSALSKRWRILTMLSEGKTQRDIAEELNVSLCKVTRGAKILKNPNTILSKVLIKEENHEYRFRK